MVLMTRFLGFMMSQLETTTGRSMIGSLVFGGCQLWEAQAGWLAFQRHFLPATTESNPHLLSWLAGPGHRLLSCSRPRRPLDIRTVFFHPRRRSKMEILDEFDNESPLYISFCTRISPEEFEQQSLSYTEKSLQDLYSKMEQNPGICESIVRKRKQLDQEEAGLVSYLQAKLSLLFNGGHPLEMEEMEEEVEQLKREMQKASNYAVAAKRASQWPLARRSRKNIPWEKFCPCQTRPPEPTTPPMPKIFGPYPTQTERSTDLRMPWAGLSPINRKSLVNLHPLMMNAMGCRSSFQGSESFSRLKTSNFPRSTGSESFPSTSPSGTASVLNPPTLGKPRVRKEDGKENETTGPGSHPTGA